MTRALRTELARLIYEGRMKTAWGSEWATRSKWPTTAVEWRSYPHNPIADVDLALASADEVLFRYDLVPKGSVVLPAEPRS